LEPRRSSVRIYGLECANSGAPDTSRSRRVPTDSCQKLTLHHALVEIEFQKPRRNLPLGCERLDYRSPQYEVIVPTLATRVEETHERSGLKVQRTNIAPLPCIASKTGVGEIVRSRCPAMFAADDMVYLMWRIRIVFMKETILTSIGGALRD
jgi:hypothetical protein